MDLRNKSEFSHVQKSFVWQFCHVYILKIGKIYIRFTSTTDFISYFFFPGNDSLEISISFQSLVS